jgi:hypothetical protein
MRLFGRRKRASWAAEDPTERPSAIEDPEGGTDVRADDFAAEGAGAFLAIDFETATEQRSSACALGVALFDEGELRESSATLIDPNIPANNWNSFNIMIHGIQPDDVAGARRHLARCGQTWSGDSQGCRWSRTTRRSTWACSERSLVAHSGGQRTPFDTCARRQCLAPRGPNS